MGKTQRIPVIKHMKIIQLESYAHLPGMNEFCHTWLGITLLFIKSPSTADKVMISAVPAPLHLQCSGINLKAHLHNTAKFAN